MKTWNQIREERDARFAAIINQYYSPVTGDTFNEMDGGLVAEKFAWLQSHPDVVLVYSRT